MSTYSEKCFLRAYRAINLNEALLLFRSNDELAKRRRSWTNTKSYILTIYNFWRMGFSGFSDFVCVFIAQLFMFVSPISIQNFIYKNFLR